jgi:predicted transcriptional regulator
MATSRFSEGSSLRLLSLAADLLNATLKGADSMTVAEILKHHIPTPISQDYLARLYKLGLLAYDKENNSFRTTRKGTRFLQDYKKFQRQM